MRRSAPPLTVVPVLAAVVLAVLAAAPTALPLGPLGPAPAAAASAAGLSLGPDPVAAPGSLAEGTPVVLTLQATDPSGNPAGGAAVWLSFSSSDGPSGGSAAVSGTALTADAQRFTTGRDGQLAVTYTTAQPFCGGGVCTAPYPTSGADTVTAADAASGAAVTATDSYGYAPAAPAPPDRDRFSPDPVAGPASLAPGGQVPVSLTVETAAGQPEPGATVYLSFSAAGGGSVAVTSGSSSSPGGCPNGVLGTSPEACTTDAGGRIAMTFTAGGGGTGAGRDVITAQNTATAPTESGSDGYDYAGPVYSVGPAPLAAAGSLGSSQTVTAALLATDASGRPLVTTPVLLSLSQGSGAAAAPVGAATATGAVASPGNQAASPSLRTTPVPFETDAYGRILITYSTPPDPPATGTDDVVAQSSASSPASTATDGYTYAPATFLFSPDPVAPAGSVGPGATTAVTLTVRSGGQPQPGGTVYLSFTPGSGGGAASVGGTALGADPAPFTADGGGRVGIVYRAPSPEPKAGTDTITAEDAATNPARSAADQYRFSAPVSGIDQGYWLAARDGGIFSFGAAGFHGSEGGRRLNAPIVGIASVPDGQGYWCVASDGGVFSFGDAGFFGSAGDVRLIQPIVGMAPTADGRGYWLVARDGGIFSYGDAAFHGSATGSRLGAPVVAMAATPDGGGYWITAANGAVAAFGDARLYGSARGTRLNAPIVGMASTATGNGYWLVGADGGMFTFGDAFFFGSAGGIHLQQPIVGMAATPNGAGYWFVASDGGVFSYGNAGFHGSTGGTRLQQRVVGMSVG